MKSRFFLWRYFRLTTYRKRSNLESQPRFARWADAGDPFCWGVFRNLRNRALPGPSPSANLVGTIGLGGQATRNCRVCRRFFYAYEKRFSEFIPQCTAVARTGFGDIGTSPIYTFTVIFLLTAPTEANIMGILSLIIWTLIIIVTGEYAWLAMSLSRKERAARLC